MISDDKPLGRPPMLQSKKSTHSFLSSTAGLNPASFLGTDATTAVTLASSDQAEIAIFEEGLGLAKTTLSRSSRSVSPQPSFMVLPPQLALDPLPFVELLHDFVNTSIAKTDDTYKGSKPFNILTETEEDIDESYLEEKVHISKKGEGFTAKLKQFFILSSAGKPIYSMNGDDDVLLGYSGLITTIVASFEDGTDLLFRSISQNGFRMVVMNKSPLILVAISRVSYELMLDLKLLESQLSSVYNYLLAVLSAPVITKSFHNRMNYDLRRVLSAQDLKTLDILTSMLTFGFSDTTDDENKSYTVDPSMFISSLLDDAVQCARLSSTLRAKLDDIFVSCKRLKVNLPQSEATPFLQGKLYTLETTKLLASDLLFAFLIYDNKIVSHLHPKTHCLENKDISTLLLMLSQLSPAGESKNVQEEPDLWFPICLARFNDSGFLHCYVRHLHLPNLSRPLTLLLLSGNKNSFFEMKQSANYIFAKICKSKTLSSSLPEELAQGYLSLTSVLKTPQVKHFIYKRRKANQYIMDPLTFSKDTFENIVDSMFILYLYTALSSSKSEEVRVGASMKKLTYTRWHLKEGFTGFLLADEKYELYCLCKGFVTSLVLIEQSLRIVNWCENYRKRLFIGPGVQF